VKKGKNIKRIPTINVPICRQSCLILTRKAFCRRRVVFKNKNKTELNAKTAPKAILMFKAKPVSKPAKIICFKPVENFSLPTAANIK